MRIARTTKSKINEASADIKGPIRQQIQAWKIRLEEHPATKRTCRQIDRILKTIEEASL